MISLYEGEDFKIVEDDDGETVFKIEQKTDSISYDFLVAAIEEYHNFCGTNK